MLDFSHSRLKPFKHQIEDTQFLIDHPYLFIASEMRTGKSKIVIDGAQFLYINGVIDRVIVVAPKPVLDVWFDPDLGELNKHLWQGMSAKIIEFHARPRAWYWGERQDDQLNWIVTNYEFIRNTTNLDILLKYCTQSTLLVCDESSFIKNYRAQQTKACFELRKRCGRVALLNGTPISHSPLDLFSQGNLLHPDILKCSYITHYKARYAQMAPVMTRGKKVLTTKWGHRIEEIVGWVNLDDLQNRFAPHTIRRLQKDCLDLPPKLDPVPISVPLEPATWKAYKDMRDECVVFFENAQKASIAAQAIVKTVRLSQITSGFVGGVQDTDIEMERDITVQEIGREKLDLLLWFLEQRLAEDKNLHIVVWCRFRVELFRMIQEVTAKFPQFQIGSIFGAQKRAERLAALTLLKPETSPKGPVFVGGTYGTGSYGLDFTAAHTSVNCSYDYSLGKYLQSGDRVYGPGQTQPVAYFDFIATGPNGQKTIDHIILKARKEAHDIATWTSAAWIRALQET